MPTNATFYHAGCPVCITAEKEIVNAVDKSRYNVEIIHLGEEPGKIDAARADGVKSVPALVINNQPLHINFGASLDDLAS